MITLELKSRIFLFSLNSNFIKFIVKDNFPPPSINLSCGISLIDFAGFSKSI